jgi:hypothetical protein
MIKQEKKILVLVVSLVLVILSTLLMVYFVQDFIKNSSIEPLSYQSYSEVSLLDSLEETLFLSPKKKLQTLLRSENVNIEQQKISSKSHTQSENSKTSQTELVAGLKALPVVDSLLLNTTSAANSTNDNLTAHITTSDGDLDDVKVIYNWYKDSDSITVLNMPFEGNSSDQVLLTDSSSDFNSDTQGSNSWYYYRSAAGSNTYTQLIDGGSIWVVANPYSSYEYLRIASTSVIPGTVYGDVVRAWNSTINGKVHIVSTISDGDSGCWDGITYIVKKGNTQLFSNNYNNGFSSTVINLFTDVSIGDVIYFRVSDRSNNYCDRTNEDIQIYQAGNTTDYSGLGNDGTVYGPTWSATGGFDEKGAYEFDGSSNYISFDDSSSLEPSSISFGARIKVQGDGSHSDGVHILTKGRQGTTPYSSYSIIYYPTTDLIKCQVGVSGAWSGVASTSMFTPPSDWTHVLCTYDGSTIKTYINGTMENSGSYPGSITYGMSTDDKLHIGDWGYSTYTRRFQGYIDEVQVYNRALSADQIYALYQNRTDEIVSSETGYNENWKVIAYPNDASEDGISVTSNNVTIINNLPIISSLMLNATSLSNSTNDNLTAYVTTNDLDGEDVKVIYNWLKDSTSISVLNMPFEKINSTTTNNAHDYSGFGNDGTISGPTWSATAGHDGKGAYNFDGGNDQIYISDDSSLDITGEITLSAWIYPESLSGTNEEGGILCKRNCCTTDNYHMSVGTYSSQDSRFGFVFYSSGWRNCWTDSNLALNNWYHVTTTYDSTTANLYVNGELNKSCNLGYALVTNNEMLRIGSGTSGDFYFDGKIDDVRIYNNELSPDQVYKLYQNKTDEIVAAETTAGESWTVVAYPNDAHEDGTGVTSNSLVVQAAFSAPTQTENNITNGEGSGEGTNLNDYTSTTIQSVSDFTWHRKNKGKVKWNTALDLSNANIGGDSNLNNDVEVGTRFVSVDSSTATAFASKSADVTFENVDCSLCNSKDILYSSSYYTSLSEIQGNGISCSLAGKCSSISCTNPGSTGNCTFTASSFSGYALGGNANLTINDSVEGSSALTDTEVSFYAKYLNVTDNSPIHSATCNITFDDAPGTWYDMTWNGTGTNLYNFTKTAGFASANTHTWNVTCSKTGFTTLLANDTIEIQSLASSSGGTSNQTGKVNFTQAGSAGIILQDDGIAFGSGYFNTTCSQSYSVLDSASLFNAGQNGAYASPGCWINTTALNVYDEGVDSAQDYHWIENNGTTIVSISASADKDGPDFICGRLEGGVCVTASANFSVKAAANETSACSQGLNSTYQPMGADGINNTVPLCAMLHFADTKDDLKIYYKISIPSDIMPGFKTMAITYIATAL